MGLVAFKLEINKECSPLASCGCWHMGHPSERALESTESFSSSDFKNVTINHLALFLLRPMAPRQQQDLHSNPAHILPTEVRDGHLNSQAAFTWGINVDQSEVFPEIKTLTRILDEA